MKPIKTLLLATLALSAPAFAKEEGEEKSLTLADVPAKVAASIRAAAGDAAVSIEEEDENGVDSFEVKWTTKERKHEITVSGEGVVLSEEEVIPLAEAPAPVQAVIKATAGELFDIEKSTEKGVTLYEAGFKTAGGKLELKLDAEGKEIARETEKKEKEDKDEEHEEKDGEEEDDD